MNFEQYAAVLKNFKGGAFTSIKESYDDICRAQDLLITELTNHGAVIKGWKVVEDDSVFILSPIFDFQLFNRQGARLPKKELLGIEVEICYQCHVPASDDGVASVINNSQPLVAVEVLRPKINDDSYNACDFYFNYGIFVSDSPVSGDFVLESGEQNQVYDYSTSEAVFLEQKKSILFKGVLECIRRGYVEEDYFFMTGSLNGLIETYVCLGKNNIIHNDDKLIRFEIV